MIHELVSELKTEMRRVYGGRLKGVYLFGSYTRGDQDSESDVDVLIVLDAFDHYGAEIDRTGDFIGVLSLKYGVTISSVFIKERDWLEGEIPLVRTVREEVVPL